LSLPRMSWHIGDYHKDTGHLRAAGHGAYFLLCMHYWATGGLPNDDKQLAAIARMTDREWMAHRETLKALFKLGEWKHKRIEDELKTAQAKYEKLSQSGRDGNAKRWRKPSPPDTPGDRHPIASGIAMGSQPITDNPKEDSEANASDGKPSDPRTRLFQSGLKTLANITGKTPDSCRSLVGRWLKAADDEAIHVLAAIEDAERNRVADPVAWINKTIGVNRGQAKPTLVDAAKKLANTFADRPGSGIPESGNLVRLLPQSGRGGP
jgi:uncharacterized protein YdaU (DUF1376 family)